jgi:hypothetical protein
MHKYIIHPKHMKIIKIAILLGILLPSCVDNHETTINIKNQSESFQIFYKRFTSDSIFQLSRVSFPLKGHYMDNDIAGTVEEDTYIWTKQNWRIIHHIDKSKKDQYKITENISDSLAIIKTEGIDENFIFEETYKKINGKWFLITLTDLSM